MQRGLLKNFAHVIGQKFIGWCFMDLERLSQLGEGELRMDVLTGETFHNRQPIGQMQVAGEISAWFVEQLKEQDVDHSQLEYAHLLVVFTSDDKVKRSGNRVITLDLALRGEISYAGKTFSSEIREPHTFIAMDGAWFSPATESTESDLPS